ncbi:hypothetical protein GW765_02095 [Candidatus Parcubacteria bacterium]|uniref:DUF4145 domain-containing protein n=1 Tax=Candidatus Uhrbacteria bacterium CG_4_9_14_3_um_filter_41_35 TaxID=1975034 RepID=A0A2M7XET8_9BACT|nr:hypothetical protein [Candidatus Parcubacteria bacterium]PIQ67514.1 MAG: hypothetical protein COV92_02530 [Candidatus Uhrbacteria bacterium CG11_big_fil_rev_8_21_14_0_20_41_9]PIZ54164.1 MAG: hypothetical protein COY25_02410 [Candidatus Uhrbacteria bacterium CG_4_10_14_0_2_um_filter_41_7]PJA46246.1 MAG: hypothetical protein CO173_03265 [Candidatus Uhrbacteria bacterium CG_4_9_14_3_um_filter_41_35]
MTDITKLLNHEDALKYIVQYLGFKDTQGFSTYGYDLYLPNAMRKWCQEHTSQLGVQAHEAEKFVYDISPYFYEAAWELCRRGILRPGVQSYGKQSTDDGSAGNGYSITPFGKQWLSESDKDIFIPTEPGRFSEMLAPFSKIFGSGFHERANEAIRCYNGHTYLACCVMCGAAAESILLHLAIQKEGVEEKVLKLYKASNGRKKLEDLIVGQQKQNLKIDFEVCFGLLKYWRDEAAHGRKSTITESEAYTSLALLLRCAQFAQGNYQSLTSKLAE